MRKNVLLPISLLFIFVFILSSCAGTKTRYSKRPVSKKEKSEITNKGNLRDHIIRDAKSLLGANYKYGGKTPKAFDCSGYTSYVMTKNGIEIPSGSSYQSKMGKKVQVQKSKRGDLLFFGKKGNVSHVAIVVENSRNGIFVIHSTTTRGVVIDRVDDSTYWAQRMMYGRNLID